MNNLIPVERRNWIPEYYYSVRLWIIESVRMKSMLVKFHRAESSLARLPGSRHICQIWRVSKLWRNDDYRIRLPSPQQVDTYLTDLDVHCVPWAVLDHRSRERQESGQHQTLGWGFNDCPIEAGCWRHAAQSRDAIQDQDASLRLDNAHARERKKPWPWLVGPLQGSEGLGESV